MEKLKHLFARQKHSPEFKKPFAYSPERVWKIMLLVSGMILIVIIVLSWFFFRALSSDSVFDSNGRSSKSELIHRSKLEVVLSHYKEKAQKFKTLQTEKPSIEDPSL
jgi:heme/copper-type cytochrome/quinol oxidase subunit 2